MQTRRTQRAGLQCRGAQAAAHADVGPAALNLPLASQLAAQWRAAVGGAQGGCGGLVQAGQRLQAGQCGGVDLDPPAVGLGARRELALQQGAVAAGAEVGIDRPAGCAAIQLDLALHRHASQQAVAQLEFGLAAPGQQLRRQRAWRGRRRAGLQFGLPASGQAVRALAPGAGGRAVAAAREPQRRVDGGQFTAAAQLPQALCAALGG